MLANANNTNLTTTHHLLRHAHAHEQAETADVLELSSATSSSDESEGWDTGMEEDRPIADDDHRLEATRRQAYPFPPPETPLHARGLPPYRHVCLFLSGINSNISSPRDSRRQSRMPNALTCNNITPLRYSGPEDILRDMLQEYQVR